MMPVLTLFGHMVQADRSFIHREITGSSAPTSPGSGLPRQERGPEARDEENHGDCVFHDRLLQYGPVTVREGEAPAEAPRRAGP